MKDELQEVKERYGDPRRTQIVPDEHEFNAEDFYPNDPVVITVSHLGYIKRTPLSEFREQSRGGVGSKGARSREQDFTEYIYPATMHQTMMFFLPGNDAPDDDVLHPQGPLLLAEVL